jgi:hypothetical protein
MEDHDRGSEFRSFNRDETQPPHAELRMAELADAASMLSNLVRIPPLREWLAQRREFSDQLLETFVFAPG